ncbi:MAG: lipocalin family protein [Bacteroidetes bacterium]|nr:lipocalin family protein [Bacteroidota bacterium]MBU1720044.1 lipocalin family protein [Bacteroidota bacterium]
MGQTRETVKSVDLQRYMGVWYEIARFPHSFEKNLVGVTATYKLKENGRIEVLNQGYLDSLNGKPKTAKGKGKLPDKSVPGKLKVSFFLCFYADYNILVLDEKDYSYALIGSKSDNFLWILCRTPKMSDEIYNMLVSKAKELGYPIEKLYKVPQAG